MRGLFHHPPNVQVRRDGGGGGGDGDSRAATFTESLLVPAVAAAISSSLFRHSVVSDSSLPYEL